MLISIEKLINDAHWRQRMKNSYKIGYVKTLEMMFQKKTNPKLPGPRSHLNLISSVIDANFIYGSDKETADGLRTLKGGLLKSTPMFREHGLKDLLPLKLENPDDGCIRATPDTYCFMAGIGPQKIMSCSIARVVFSFLFLILKKQI